MEELITRRRGWKRSEEEFLIENYEKMTTEELSQSLSDRTKKSINRKLEKLRDEGRIGHRTDDTIRRAYYQRSRSGGLIGVEADNEGVKRRRGRLPVDDYGYEEV